jgi:hypothetical protein
MIVGRQPDRVTYAVGFEELLHLGTGEGGIGAEVAAPIDPPQDAEFELLIVGSALKIGASSGKCGLRCITIELRETEITC